MLAVAVSGYADSEGAVDAPIMPLQVIFADYLAAYVGSAAVATALYRRSIEGGSYQIRVSLTQMCMWAQELGLQDASALGGALPFADIVKQSDIPTTKIKGPFGEVTYLPSQITVPDIKPGFKFGTQPIGSSLLEWIN